MTAIFLCKKNKFGYCKRTKKNFLIPLIIFCIIFLFIAFVADKKIFDNAIIQSKFVINNMINCAITAAVDEAIKKNNIESSDFCSVNSNNNQINSVVTNTVLINKFCNELAVCIPQEFLKLGYGQIKIPLGAIFSSVSGFNLFNTLGPCVKIRIVPAGNALIDYETKFISAGINQTNFQIWLNVRFNSQIVNPLQKKEIVFQKKVPLVNTIINGSVPNAYIDGKNLLK